MKSKTKNLPHSDKEVVLLGESLPLEKFSQTIGYFFSSFLFLTALWLLFFPSFTFSIAINNINIEITKSIVDNATVVITLFTMGFVTFLFSMNGLRFVSFSINGVKLDTVGPQSIMMSSEQKNQADKNQTDSKPIEKSAEISIPKVDIEKTKNETCQPDNYITTPVVDQNGSDYSLQKKFLDLSWYEKKILRTLWKYQNSFNHNNYSKLWTFTLFQSHPEYMEFNQAVGMLLKENLIQEDKENKQYALTQNGIQMMRSLSIKDFYDIDYYPFTVSI